MPGSSSGRLCPICDSPIEEGAMKCTFCGTDLTIFESELEGAKMEEDQLIKEGFAEAESVPARAEIPAEETEGASETEVEEKTEEERPAAEAPSEAVFECPACKGHVTEADKICPHCGAMFVEDEAQFECPACGVVVNADATKCSGCGAIFVEDESEAAAADEEAAGVSEIQVTPSAAEEVKVVEVEAEEAPRDEEMDRVISAVKKTRQAIDAAPLEKKAPEAKRPRKGLGFFKGLMSREETKPSEEVSTPSHKKRPAEISEEVEPMASKAVGREPSVVIKLPEIRREFPTDPREQGKELAKRVAEVRALLGTATDRDLSINEVRAHLDSAIMAGRERQFLNALQIITEAEERLYTRLSDYMNATFEALRSEIDVAGKLGGNPSRAKAFLKEASRAAKTSDFQATLVFIDKAKNELAPVTGMYNETRDSLRKFERLIRDARVVGIDTAPMKEELSKAKEAFDSFDFSEASDILKKSTDEVFAMIPARMEKEVEMAKQMLVEAKMKTDQGLSPQITILKSAIRNLKEDKYLDALSDLKRFKKEMKRILSSS